jgi:iron complex outermembrane receptor protein
VGAPPPALLNSAAAFSAASGGDNLSACTVTQRSSSGPQWSSTLNTEYRVPFGATLEGYARGLLSLYGNSKNDPTNAVDDYDAYELLNVYIGIRDANGVWDVALYGKNITETEEVLTRSASTLTTPYRIPTGPTSAIAVNSPTNYYGGLAGNSAAGLTMTPAREFGMMVRYSFGSR